MGFRSTLAAGCLLAALMVVAPKQAAANLVANGDFETGDFSGWSTSIDPTWDGVDTAAPQAGNWAAFFGNPFAVSTISQAIATIAGGFYQIDFWLQTEADPNGTAIPNSFAFDWDGATRMSLTDAPEMGYTHYSFVFQATTALTDLSFSFSSQPAFWDFDSVSVVATTSRAPEPGSLALVGLACALGAYARRRRA